MTTYQREIISLDTGWNSISRVITKLKRSLNGTREPSFNSQECMTLYMIVYGMCDDQKPANIQSLQVYEICKEAFDDYLTVSVLPSLKEKRDEFMLRELIRRWGNHTVMVRWFSRFFHYLNHSFVARRSLPTLKEVGLTCFRDLIYLELNANAKAKDAVISLKVQHELFALLKDDKVEDLLRMCRLFSEITRDSCSTMFKKLVTEDGNALVKQAEDAASNKNADKRYVVGTHEHVFTKALMDLHDKYLEYVNYYFQNQTLFHKALKEASEVFCSKDVAGESNAEFLATVSNLNDVEGGIDIGGVGGDSGAEEEEEPFIGPMPPPPNQPPELELDVNAQPLPLRRLPTEDLDPGLYVFYKHRNIQDTNLIISLLDAPHNVFHSAVHPLEGSFIISSNVDGWLLAQKMNRNCQTFFLNVWSLEIVFLPSTPFYVISENSNSGQWQGCFNASPRDGSCFTALIRTNVDIQGEDTFRVMLHAGGAHWRTFLVPNIRHCQRLTGPLISHGALFWVTNGCYLEIARITGRFCSLLMAQYEDDEDDDNDYERMSIASIGDYLYVYRAIDAPAAPLISVYYLPDLVAEFASEEFHVVRHGGPFDFLFVDGKGGETQLTRENNGFAKVYMAPDPPFVVEECLTDGVNAHWRAFGHGPPFGEGVYGFFVRRKPPTKTKAARNRIQEENGFLSSSHTEAVC